MASLDALKTLNALVSKHLPVEVLEHNIAGGGRGLFATQRLPHNVAVGPISPIAAVSRVLKQQRLRGKKKTNNVRYCAVCLKPISPTKNVCEICSRDNVQIWQRVQNVLSTHKRIEDQSESQSEFCRIAERTLLRILVESEFDVGDLWFLTSHLVVPDVGEETESQEWQALWEESKSRLIKTAEKTKIEAELQNNVLEDGSLFFHVVSALHLNAIESNEITALYPALSLMNHSCVPSCGLYFQKAAAFLVPKRDIEPGEELTIHYAENQKLPADRLHDFLYYHYGFECPQDCSCGKRKSRLQ